MDIFENQIAINELLSAGKENDARDLVIKLLDYHERQKIEYSPLLNHVIRSVGLFPYLKPDTSNWQERFVFDAFKSDIGSKKDVTLHREQSSLLKRLIQGESIAVSAPTSFGKSFVIDAFIASRKPKNVAIIVPTIALTDETRRRLYPKFSREYKIITTGNVELGDKNIFIFPQERAIDYCEKIQELDILIIDEFYKASPDFDNERSSPLLRAILKLRSKAKQQYFLAPNITKINHSIFTQGIEFVPIDFNTVFLERTHSYKHIGKNEEKKGQELIKILNDSTGKTLIYAGTYADIDKVSKLILDQPFSEKPTKLLKHFSKWLSNNYDPDWQLTGLSLRGVGIHNGKMHRSLSQIQVKLFEEPEGLKNIISTSSIIEGVNTSAENVILWRNRNGRHKLKDFTYRNIIGRGGRMFKHFIGKIFLLEEPPDAQEIPLNIEIPDELLSEVNETEHRDRLSKEQISQIISKRENLIEIIGKDSYENIKKGGMLQSADWNFIQDLAIELKANPSKWKGLSFLHSEQPDKWDTSIYNIIKLKPGAWDIHYSKFVEFVKILAGNWNHTIPSMLKKLARSGIDVETFFKLERNVSYKFSSLLHDVNTLQKELLPQNNTDIGSFVSQTSNAFLPPIVYQLEEYGLPRTLSKKIHRSAILDFLDEELTLHDAIASLNQLGLAGITKKLSTQGIDNFDIYILGYFFEGISSE